MGGSLMRGFEPDHPLIEEIKRKGFIAVAALDMATLLSPGFADEVDACFRAGQELMRFLCEAIELPF